MDKFANIEALVSVVDAGGFGKAAERLGIAKSVVSRRVGALEAALGVQLLQRTTRTQSLTTPGRQFYEQAVRILGDLEEAEQSVADASADLRGRLKLAAPLSFGLHHLTTVVSEFMLRHPGIELTLDLNDREVNLVEEGFDMAVRIGMLEDSTLLARRIGDVRLMTCASPAYLGEHGTPETPRALETHIGLHYANAPLRQVWQFAPGRGEPEVVIPRIRLQSNNGDALAAAAATGLGIINIPEFIVRDMIANGQLVPILTEFRRPPLGVYAVFPPGRLMTRRTRALSDHLAGHLRGETDRGTAG